jgi:hypothetical protein
MRQFRPLRLRAHAVALPRARPDRRGPPRALPAAEPERADDGGHRRGPRGRRRYGGGATGERQFKLVPPAQNPRNRRVAAREILLVPRTDDREGRETRQCGDPLAVDGSSLVVVPRPQTDAVGIPRREELSVPGPGHDVLELPVYRLRQERPLLAAL